MVLSLSWNQRFSWKQYTDKITQRHSLLHLKQEIVIIPLPIMQISIFSYIIDCIATDGEAVTGSEVYQ